MSETALWLNYCLSGVLAFLVVRFWRWRLVSAIVLGTAISLLYLLVSFAHGARSDDPWLGAALFINGFFSLVSAVGGAIIALALRDLRNGS